MGIHVFVAAFAMVVGAQTAGQGQSQTPYEPGNGVTNPELVRKVDPKYTEQAKAQKITGEVWLDVVVQTDGTVKVLGVKKSLDKSYGLDEQAIEAAKQWLFKPGSKDGKTVPVRVVLILEFRDRAAGEVRQPGPPIKDPVLRSKIDPHYSQEAMRAKITGEVWLDVIVETNGSVTVLGVKKSLDKDFGLDDAAIDAAKQWKFDPGTLDGKPVRVRITLVMEFRLH